MNFPLFLLLLALPLAVSAKAVKKPEANIEKRKPARNADAPIVLTTAAPNFCLFGGQSGKSHCGEAAFKSIVWKSDVVYVGAGQGRPLDHLAQLEALKALRIARGSKIAVAFGTLGQPLQPALNDFADGKLSEEDFLAKAARENEGGDFALYKPLLDFIVLNKLRAIALKVPGKVTGKIARGGLDSLSSDEKQYLPEKVELSQHKNYNERLKAAFGSAPDGASTLENYLASVAAGNEGMGARVADFLAVNPGYSVLVLAGNDSLLYNAALPASVKARVKDVRQASFYTESAAECPETLPKEHKDLANYLWYLNHAPKPAPPAPLPALSTATLSVSPSPSPVPGK